MTDRIITVTVSDAIYSRIEEAANHRARSVDEFIAQTITHDLQILPETDLPRHVQAELEALEHLTDDALRTIARSIANEDKVALYDVLIERQNMGALTPEGYHLPSQLRDEADAL